MEEWKEYKLEEILAEKGYIRGPFGSALKRGDMKSSGIPVYEQQHAIYQSRDFRFFIDDNKFNEMKRFQVQENDILISCSGTVGKVTIISKDDPKGIISQALLTLRVNPKLILPEYLKYFFTSQKGYNAIISRSSGSVQVNIAKRDVIEQIPINLPPLPIQQKIVEILSSLDDKIELNNKINKNLEQQAQALFKSWFVDFEPFGGKMPEGWKEGQLSDVAEYFNGYPFGSKELLDSPSDECYDVFKQGHIKKGGGFNSDGTKSWYPISKCEKLQNYILKKGDILMAMTDMKGNVAILGNTAIMPVDNKYIVNQRVGLLRAKKDMGVDYPYLYLLTNEHTFLMDLRSRANSGVQVNLSSSAIKESEINIATKKDYEDFNQIVKPLFETMLQNQLENKQLATIRDTLLPKLMNGEIEV